MKVIIVLILLSVILVACGENKQREENYEKGVSAFNQDDLELAKNYFIASEGYEDSDIYLSTIKDKMKAEDETPEPVFLSDFEEKALAGIKMIQDTIDSPNSLEIYDMKAYRAVADYWDIFYVLYDASVETEQGGRKRTIFEYTPNYAFHEYGIKYSLTDIHIQNKLNEHWNADTIFLHDIDMDKVLNALKTSE